MTVFQELKRRNVIRVSVAYLLAAWVLLQIVDFVLEVIAAPDWILQVFVLAAAVGLPVAMIFAWVFEMTPEGIKRESQIDRTQSITPQTGQKLDRVIIITLALAVIFLLVDKFMLTPETQESGNPPAAVQKADSKGSSLPAASQAARSIAVLPFIAMSQGLDDEYFADGLTEEILNSLSQLPELLVTARTSAFSFKGQDVPVQEIAEKLGVRHIVEGSVRRSGDRLRVTAQLIRADDGFHLWSENYDSTSEDTIAVQEDIAEKIAVAMNVVMDKEKRELMKKAGLRDVEAFIAFQKGFDMYENAHGQENQTAALHEANVYFDEVNRRVPGYPPAVSRHADVYVHTLMDDATNEPFSASQQEVQEALPLAVADYQTAIQNARTPEERNSLEIDLAFITGNWRGAPSRIERFMVGTGCESFTWLDPLAINLGYAKGMAVLTHQARLCDPLAPSSWWSEVRSLLWTGESEKALEAAGQGLEVVQHEWLKLGMVMALASLGRFEQADVEIDTRFQTEEFALAARVFNAALQGDDKNADKWQELLLLTSGGSGFWELLTTAWKGDREKANRLATEIDQKPFGPVALSLTTWWCACGGPWELEATPNFGRMVGETGHSWPPPSPINFPLKDW